MERLTTILASALCLLPLACTQTVPLSDGEHLRNHVLPVLSKFAENHGLDDLKAVQASQLSSCRITRNPKHSIILASLIVEDRYHVSVYEREGHISLHHIYGVAAPWSLNPTDVTPAQKRVLEALPNTLSSNRALELLRWHFKTAGHDETNFHPVAFRQFIYGVGPEGNQVLRLPYYEALWFRRDVDIKEFQRGKITMPRVELVISGIDHKLVSYGKFSMPTVGDWGNDPPKPAHPNSTENYFLPFPAELR